MAEILSDFSSSSVDIFPTDVFTVSYPRSGLTWFRSLLYGIMEPKWLHKPTHINRHIPDIRRTTVSQRDRMNDPRFFKTHEFCNPRYRNVVYMIRDVRAVALSSWNWRTKMIRYSKWKYEGDFDIAFIRQFIKGRIFPGCWKQHVNGWTTNKLQFRKRLIMTYEELFNNTEDTLKTVCDFIGIKTNKKKITNTIKVFPPGAPTYFLVWSTKPTNANPDGWINFYTNKMLNEMNKEYGEILERFGYEI